MMDSPVLLDARRVLLQGLIDYAGLFPPASLGIEAAVARYREARHGAHTWVLGRFISTASRLEELAGVLTATMTVGEPTWPISVVLDGDVAAAAAAAQSFDAHMGNAAEVVLTEVRPPIAAVSPTDPGEMSRVVTEVARAATSVSPTVTALIEVRQTSDWDAGIPTAVEAIAAARRSVGRSVGAKFRCGGTVADAFPSPEQIARFLSACRSSGVPYKTTAGLHHPIRHFDPDLGVMMHGFLNVLAAAALAEEGADESMLVEVLSETDPTALRVTRSSLEWRSSRVGVATIRALRSDRFPSYGSCSFDEPVTDLIELGVLPT
jgi:hypothetical protein